MFLRSVVFKQAAMLAVLILPWPVFPQATSIAEISGSVTDPNGARIPSADVKATQTNTGFVRATKSGGDGAYVLSNLPTGPYRLEVTAPGFKTYLQEGIVLEVNSNPAIQVVLEIGSLSQQVEVKADAAMAETQSNSISQVIDQQRVVDLPLNGRQATQLVLLSGAATLPPSNGVISSKNYPSSLVISVAGGQSNGTYYLLDGGDHNDKYGNVNLPFPFPDALQEFSVQTNTTQANFGVGAGAVVNVVTRSGGNQYHGNVFEFLRNGATNARNFFAPTPDSLKRNQYGGTFGGPIRRNKLFFFGGYQGTNIRTAPVTNTAFVPNATVLTGNLSVLESSACGRARTLTDPNTGLPFANNFINPARFNQQALNLLKYVPLSTDPCGTVLYGITNKTDEQQFIGRVDWNRSEKHSLYGRYFFTDLKNPSVFDGKNILETSQPGVLPRVQTLTVGDTYSISPSIINSAHFTWIREHITRGPASNIISPQDIGLQVPPSPGNFAQITVSGRFGTLCGTCTVAHINNGSLQFADDVNLVRGSHQISLGFDWIHSTVDYLVTGAVTPIYTFDGSVTGDALADFLLGLPNSFTVGNVNRYRPEQNYIGLYANDNYRLSSRLSLNFGIRWEPYLPEHDVDGRATHFDYTAFLAHQVSKVFQNAPPGILFPGDPGMTDSGTNPHLADFAPRVGVVWNVRGNGRTVVRSSYGILYDLADMQIFDRFGIGPPWGSSTTIFNPVGGFTNPYLNYTGPLPSYQNTPPGPTTVFPPAGQYVNLPLHIHPPYTQQWNLTIQQQVGSDWLFSASYLGNKSTHRWITQQSNPAVYIPGTCAGKPCSSTANTNARRVLSLQDPVAGAGIGTIVFADDGANANYNGMLLSAKHRLSKHFSVLANYTWSHCISDGDFNSELAGVSYQNPADRKGDRGNCQADQRQIFNASIIAETPRFSGFLERKLFSDWQYSTVITKRTGFWFSPVTGVDDSLTGLGADRPDLIGNSKLPNPTIQEWFNTAAFRANATGSFGNSGRDSIQGPGGFTMDAALVRRFTMRERYGVEARAEAFNMLNHPVFSNPVATFTSSTFGRILTAADPRIFQFALKFAF